MKISVIAPAELDRPARQRWRELQASTSALGSPYFSCEFTLAVADSRPDVRIAVLEEDNAVVGFFPYQVRWGAGLPVGGCLSDHHGVIAAPDTQWRWEELLRASRLAYWQFDHLAAWQRPQQMQVTDAVSPGIDLSCGFAAYKRGRLDAGHRIGKLDCQARKLARELGPLRFEANARDPRLLETVVQLKLEQCRRTGAIEFFSWPWTRALVERIHGIDDPLFGGRLSALYAGDTLVAAHFGMRSQRVWHWWFPVYDHAHARHSPGALLLLSLAEAAAAQGHELVDLGKGQDAYKDSFADCSLPLLEGCVTRPAVVTLMWQIKKDAGHWLRTSPVAQPLRPILRQARRLRYMYASP